MARPEDKLQFDICQYLQSVGVWFHSVPNEAAGKANRASMPRLVAMGLRSGAPDLILYLSGGKVLLLELKSTTGRLSYPQHGFRVMVERLGHHYYLCRSLEDVKTALRQHGVDKV